ncbi:MAG: hypothetical protein WC389_00410 [Lutibacter sp.]|jgi:hypothetical protein
MKKITIKNLIDYKRKSDKSKITFVNNLKKEKKSDGESGGDYWITSLSAISNVYKFNKPDLLGEKTEELRSKIEITSDKRVKDQFQRNIDILEGFKDFDLQQIKPKSELIFLKQPKSDSIFDIKGLPIEAKPRFIFSFTGENDKEIGGIWFVAKLKGYSKTELGMFAEMIFRYLNKVHSNNYFVNPKYCIAIDVTDGKETNYKEIIDGKISSIIESTIEEIKKN